MNKYYSAIKASVTKQKAIKQRSFYNTEKKLASWNDVCWIKSCKKTFKDLNIYFTNPYKVSKSDKATDYNKDQLLVEIAGDIAKLYAIDILSKKVEQQQNFNEDENDVRKKLQAILVEEKKFESDRIKLRKELKFYEINDDRLLVADCSS